ncbi:DUF523 domain-containing protein [Reinekea thalattae]|uniref:DUF523 domain-containing protein n=1 Tax=Reinekea thalattae TaxID=2593301 RepID=A0A5C8Z8D4_9GAMM|nr:DUF523 domain-containing protein [Reinekea thalattae]TXR54162.1 DUF523 domain-containing protein [Reinekea thalattae]
MSAQQQPSSLLVSACLLGQAVRYDGGHLLTQHPFIELLRKQNRLVSICPEVIGGLPTPRPPAELIASGKIVTIDGDDVSAQFQKGAELALKKAQETGCSFALLAAGSPSCGNERIYDGSFSGKLIAGAGATAQLLMDHGIRVFNQHQLEQLEVAMGS